MFLSCLHRQHRIQWGLWKQNVCKDWKHMELNTKGKMSVAMFEKIQSEETKISSNGDRVSDLVREGNIWIAFKW